MNMTNPYQYNTQQNAYSNPAFLQSMNAQNALGMNQLQNNYNQVQNNAMQNMANRFGGINTSALNDSTYQANRQLGNQMTNLANADAANIPNQYQQWRTNLGSGQGQPTSYLNNIPQYGSTVPQYSGQSQPVNPFNPSSTQWGSWENNQASARIMGY